MPTSFTSTAVRLRQLFDNRFSYTIPIYQRPYSWTKVQSTKLFDDIVEAMGTESGEIEVDAFFIGALILTGNMKEVANKPLKGELVEALNKILSQEPDLPETLRGNFDVVDGKQRLVTLKILLCLLRDLSPDNAHSSYCDVIGDGNGENRYRLELCGGESDFLKNHVLVKGSSIRPVIDEENMSDGEKKMMSVRKNLHDNLLDLSQEHRDRMLTYLVNHCEVVIILSEQIDHAFKIFLSINDTGKELSEGDILKAELMAELSKKDVEKYRDTWEQWNDSLGEERNKAESRKKTFFNHFRYVLTSNPVNILADFRKTVDLAGGAEPFIRKDLIPNIKAYEIICSASWPAPENKNEMEQILGRLNWLPHDDWMATAMLAIHRFKGDPERTLFFFQKLERLAYGMLIMPGGYADRKKKYNPIKRGLREPSANKDPFKEVEFSNFEKKIIRNIIERGIHKSRPAAAKLLLLRLDMELSGRDVSYYNALIEEEPLSVEHLLPLNPGKNSKWRGDFPDDKLRIFNTELFGNLFLVHKVSENPKMGNDDFTAKHKVLFDQNKGHAIYLTNELRLMTQWLPKDIARRQERLLFLVDHIWPLE